ncbi:vomeronasal type-1 receptor 4-like [Diceros bicornis minor]|uniref:vomeronasal type-1 receptor 4-like n=1 Tax=Diceros bicornis minor TaxID=77932 RepID=UPI0026F3595E|nr:vomeronasal type-1 receptor 4-like [Diceros bicornis minor]
MIRVAYASYSHAGNSRSEDKYHSQRPDRMATRDFTVGMVFLSENIVGILGNISLLYHYLFLHFTGCRLRSTDLIVEHLPVANTLAMLSTGIPSAVAAFGWKHFLSDIGCKLAYYIHRVASGVSIGTTCLLSVFQAITISPRNSRWAELKVKAPKYIGFSIFLCWILQLLINIIFTLYVTGNRSNKHVTKKKDLGLCSTVIHDRIRVLVNVGLLLFPDVSCLGLMVWTSGFMVFILYRHKQQVQHLHRTDISPRASAESRATQSILVLASTFVSLYTLSSIFHIYLVLSNNPSWWLVNSSVLITTCFPTVSPYILMCHDHRVSTFFFAWIRIR